MELVRGLKEIAEKKGCTAGQLSLAWLLAQGDDVRTLDSRNFCSRMNVICVFDIVQRLWGYGIYVS